MNDPTNQEPQGFEVRKPDPQPLHERYEGREPIQPFHQHQEAQPAFTPGTQQQAETVIEPQHAPQPAPQPAAETVVEGEAREVPPAQPQPAFTPRASETRAADGYAVPGAAMTAGQTIDLLSGGAFSMEAHEKIRDLMATLTDVNEATGQKAKGKITIVLDFEKDQQFFTVGTDINVVKPKEKRARSVLWSDEHNNPTRFQPNQYQMLGMRQVGGTGGFRN